MLINLEEVLTSSRILPVVDLPSVEAAVPLAEALVGAGLPVVEIALRSPWAVQAIRTLRRALPEVCVGAGTVLTLGQAEAALEADAQFLVAPGLNPGVARFARRCSLPYIPGVATATEVSTAVRLGIEFLKFFPAVAAGGVGWIEAMQGPFPGVKFLPSGGISESNLAEYLMLPNVVACAGSWMVKPHIITQTDIKVSRDAAMRAVNLGAAAALKDRRS